MNFKSSLPGMAPLILALWLPSPLTAQTHAIDLADTAVAPEVLSRVYGSVGDGSAGLPVAGGGDLDGDGHVDYAFAAFQASPLGRSQAGQVFIVFGNGQLGRSLDTAQSQPAILPVYGAGEREHAGSEIWMDDVTGDGLAELLICRQDFTPSGGPVGAGALTLLVGGMALRSLADAGTPVDLAAPDPSLTVLTVHGMDTQDRFCMWARTGDVDGDGIRDLAVGADQAGSSALHTGELWVLRGGAHLAASMTINLADYAAPGFTLAGQVARVRPPAGAPHTHFGATCQVADLDGNGRAEVLASSALNRAGGSLGPAGAIEPVHGSGGTVNGTLYLLWDDNFPAAPWSQPFEISLDAAPGALTVVDGSSGNDAFGEELLGGLDYDGSGSADLFVGDLTGSAPGRSISGLGHVLFDVATLRGLSLALDSPPPGLVETRIWGPVAGAIGADTGMHGDFDGDGLADLAFSSPHDRPFGRANAGTVHVLFGQAGGWPALVDLAPGNLPTSLRITEVYGARGNQPGDTGDTLAYSGAAGDVDNDGRMDIFTNEMVGNGVAPGTVDVGNLIILGGTTLSEPLFADSFEAP